MVLPAFHEVVENVCSSYKFDAKHLAAVLLATDDETIQCSTFKPNFDEMLNEAFLAGGNEAAREVFGLEWKLLYNNKSFVWVMEAANKFDPDLSEFIERQLRKVIDGDDDSVEEAAKVEIRTMLEKYQKDKEARESQVIIIQQALSTESFPSPALPLPEPKLYGSFPVAGQDTFLPPNEDAQIKGAIGRIWNSNETGALLIQGDNGVGKTMEITALMHDRDFLRMLPDLEAVFWFHACKLSYQTAEFNEPHFLTELGDLFRKATPQVDASSIDALRESLGCNKKYLLIIDDAFNPNFARKVAELYLSVRCVLISRDKPAQDDTPRGNFVSDVVTLTGDENYIRRLYTAKCKIPQVILESEERMDQIIALTCGLPLIANMISKQFESTINSEVAVLRRYEEILNSCNLAASVGKSERPAMITANLLKLAFKLLPNKDRLRYYAFLFFDPGHVLNIQILEWLWKINPAGSDFAQELCDRFVDVGIVQRAETSSISEANNFIIHPDLHKAAVEDAIERGVALSLSDLRRKMVSGKLLEGRGVLNKLKRRLFTCTTPANLEAKKETCLQMAAKLRMWDAVGVFCENADDATFLKLCRREVKSIKKTNTLQMIYKHGCAHSRLCQEALLKIYARLASQQMGNKRKTVIDDISREVTQYLYDNDLTVNTRRRDGQTALMLASADGKLEVVKFLQSQGALLNEKNCNGVTAFMLASEKGHREIAEFLLSHGADLIDLAKEDEGYVLSTIESESCTVEAAPLLQNQNFSLSSEETDNPEIDRAKVAEFVEGILKEAECIVIARPLATISESTEVLVASEIPISIEKDEMQTVPTVESEICCSETAQFLAESPNLEVLETPLLNEKAVALSEEFSLENREPRLSDSAFVLSAFWKGEFLDDLIKLENGDNDLMAEKNADTRRAVLLLSSECGNLDTLKYLQSKGADFNEKDRNGRTALMCASVQGRLNTLKYLASQGANLNLKDNNGRTALMHASMQGGLEELEFLFENGANLNEKNVLGKTPLLLASENGHLPVVTFLHDRGVDLSSTNCLGWTALMSASEYGRLEVVKFLLRYCANLLNQKNKLQKTAVMLASEYGHLAVVVFLQSQGADLEAKDNKGLTALMLAKHYGHGEVVKFLSRTRGDGEARMAPPSTVQDQDKELILRSQGTDV